MLAHALWGLGIIRTLTRAVHDKVFRRAVALAGYFRRDIASQHNLDGRVNAAVTLRQLLVRFLSALLLDSRVVEFEAGVY